MWQRTSLGTSALHSLHIGKACSPESCPAHRLSPEARPLAATLAGHANSATRAAPDSCLVRQVQLFQPMYVGCPPADRYLNLSRAASNGAICGLWMVLALVLALALRVGVAFLRFVRRVRCRWIRPCS